MFGLMGIGAGFINAAGRGGKSTGEYIEFISMKQDPSVYSISCTGEMSVKSIKNGEETIVTYSDLSEYGLSIQADANTTIRIDGVVTKFITNESGQSYTELKSIDLKGAKSLQELNLDYNTDLTTLDVSKCTELTTLKCGYGTQIAELNLSKCTKLDFLVCTGILVTELDLSNNNLLTMVYLNGCQKLLNLNLSNSTLLNTLDLSSAGAIQKLNLTNSGIVHIYHGGLPAIVEIKYPATDQEASNTLAGIIENADSGHGTVYTDSQGAYYSTIETAANNKGWEIEQL